MAYKIGVSAGLWRVARDPSLLGLAHKIAGFSATQGVQFTQIDLDTPAEFYEPRLKEEVERVRKELGMEVALHGEIGELMSLDSAEKRLWEQSHLRLCETMYHAARLGFTFVNIHLSNRHLISFLEAQQRMQGYFFPVLGPYGKPLNQTILDLSGNARRAAEQEARKHMELRGALSNTRTFRQMYEEQKKIFWEETEKRINERLVGWERANPGITPDLKEVEHRRITDQEIRRLEAMLASLNRDSEFLFRIWLNLKPDEFEIYVLNDGEFGAFHIVATAMKYDDDPLWGSFVTNDRPVERVYIDDEQDFTAAVSAKYIEGHLNVKDTKWNIKYLNGMSIKEFCEKKKIYLLLETPESQEGGEGLYRIYSPLQGYKVVKHIGSPYVLMTIDFEHMLSHKLNPDVEIPKLPNDAGKYILLFHLGKPVPYFGTAHIPIPRGSKGQELIYKWLYMLRKKGWKDGYFIFERGSGRGKGNTPKEVFEDTVQALRQIAIFLEKDVPPENLPAEFYGISWENKPVYTRQLTTIREHAFDPLEGVLTIPEEKHGFLSRAAVEKQKGKEWERAKYR